MVLYALLVNGPSWALGLGQALVAVGLAWLSVLMLSVVMESQKRGFSHCWGVLF